MPKTTKAKKVKLFSTEQYQLDLELYNRQIWNDSELVFEYKGQQVQLLLLGLAPSRNDEEYWVEMHTYPFVDDELVDITEHVWRLICCAPGDENEIEIVDEYLPYDDLLPEQLLAQARQFWPELDAWAKALLNAIKIAYEQPEAAIAETKSKVRDIMASFKYEDYA